MSEPEAVQEISVQLANAQLEPEKPSGEKESCPETPETPATTAAADAATAADDDNDESAPVAAAAEPPALTGIYLFF